MSAFRATVVRYRLLWSALLLLALAMGGCKRSKPQAAPEKGEGASKVEKEAPAEKPPEASPEEEPEADWDEDVLSDVPDLQSEEAPSQPEPGEPIVDPTATDQPVTAPPRAEYVTGTDKKRLGALFVDMWCAEGRGATKEELLQIYHGYDYPPLEHWHDYWSASMVDRTWVHDTVARARSRCPDVARKTKATEKLDVPAAPAKAAEPAASK